MGNVLFIVWRESLEAVLIIGILLAFLRRKAGPKGGKASSLGFLWAGVASGIALSAGLAFATVRIQDSLSGRALEIFQTATLFVAAVLMTQMVFWMNKHGRKMKATLERDLDDALTASGKWGAALVAALAIAREGTETVVYLYGLSLENAASGHLAMALAALAGLGLALFTAWAVARGIRFLDYQTFFKVTSLVLLFSAAGLLVTGTGRLIEMDVLPSLVDPVWNTSWLLDASGGVGGIVAAFTGYRSRPSLMLVLVYAAYWLLTTLWMRRDVLFAAAAAPKAPKAQEQGA